MRRLLLWLALGHCSALRVLVTGAGGRTGKLVFEQLSAAHGVEPVGLARSKKAVKTLRKAGADSAYVALHHLALSPMRAASHARTRPND